MAESQEIIINELIAKRGTIKGKITRIQKYLQSFNNGDVIQLKIRHQKLKDTYNEFEEVQLEIEKVLNYSADQERERDDFETKYFNVEAQLINLLELNDNRSVRNGQVNTNTSDVRINPVRLPTLDLPTFAGSYLKWMSFADTFRSLIHDSNLYSDIEKFHYLKSCIKEDAAKIIENIPLTGDNYSTAWNLLNQRYDNKRLIVQEHALNIVNSPAITKNSYASLRKLLDDIVINIEALKLLGQPTDQWDGLIIPIIASKFDFVTKREWETTLTNDVPKLTDLISFLGKRATLLESLSMSDGHTKQTNHVKSKVAFRSNNNYYQSHKTQTNCNVTIAESKSLNQCLLCKKQHLLYTCNEFLNLTVPERIDKIRELNACKNCFKTNHSTYYCKSSPCRVCKGKHNSLLHLNFDKSCSNSVESSKSSTENSVESTIASHASLNNNCNLVFLATVEILVENTQGEWIKCRAFLDMGSQSNFITKSVCELLGIKCSQSKMQIVGINDCRSVSFGAISLKFKSMYTTEINKINCLVLPKITNSLPVVSVDYNILEIPTNIKLADPKFFESSSVDILLGAEIFWKVLKLGQIKTRQQNLHFQETSLGWVVGGSINVGSFLQNTSCNLSLNALNKQVTKFWEIDQWPDENHKLGNNTEQQFCEDYFKQTHKRNIEGRFIVRLPFQRSPAELGASLSIAEKRFSFLENKLNKNNNLKCQYTDFINEYKSLNHMQKVTGKSICDISAVHLPHHAVIKNDSTTTKLRVVFDASAKTSSGISLNDTLAVGPKLQDDLYAIILRFRTYQYVFTADINKMYRQILIAPEDRKYQRIVWRDDSINELSVYQLNTVTYGTACAPYLACKVLQQLAEDNKVKFPEIYRVIIHDFYMDDVLTGSNTIIKAQKLRENLEKVLASGCFELRKWSSNDIQVLSKTHVTQDSFQSGVVNFDKNGDSKTLGLYWNCHEDILRYKTNAINLNSKPYTKRKILSIVASVFDPLNLAGPISVKAKIIIQKLWSQKLGWDEVITGELLIEWNKLLEQLHLLDTFKIPRKVIPKHSYKYIELHAFCDASQKAYGTCIYVRTIYNNGDVFSNLVCAKSRVAPLKTITIPRLELCAALLMSKLTNDVIKNIGIEFNKIVYWSDSTIVLSWLKKSPATLNTFVANRVSEIQTITEIGNWRHVTTDSNPADIISRGLLPSELINNHLWYHGPSWLINNETDWPNAILDTNIDIPELKKSSVFVSVIDNNFDYINKFSSFSKLQRVIATCLRFIHNCRNKGNKIKGNLSLNELTKATCAIVRSIQQIEFSCEYVALQTNRAVSTESKLKALNPFLDKDLLIRVGGRLRNSNLCYDQKFPMVLPKHHVTNLLIRREHQMQLHAGPSATLASLRLKFWPLSGRSQVRKVIHNCIICARVKCVQVKPMMGDLPASRVNFERPFLTTGVDYAGPLMIKDGSTRNRRFVKVYIALFICFSTKAIHLELVGCLTTAGFLAALKRFIARRGMVRHLYSDNATNFVGANREIKDMFHNAEFQKVNSYLSERGISWKFIPSRAPHFGGIWEAGVKSVKYHLKRVTANANLNFEEMYTVLTGIEACLNSRPLCQLSSDPEEVDVLTPGHFLIGAPLTSLPEPEYTEVKTNRLSRWQYAERLRQHFWHRWSREYLNSLQPRSKWQRQNATSAPQLRIGALVVLKDNTPPLTWRKGRVVEVYPGSDGIIRVVSVRVDNTTIKRAVRTISVLPCSD